MNKNRDLVRELCQVHTGGKRRMTFMANFDNKSDRLGDCGHIGVILLDI